MPTSSSSGRATATAVGQWNHLKHEQVTNIRGTKQFAAHLAASSSNCRARWFPPADKEPWAPSDGTIRISYPQEHVWHLSHFSAYINAYEMIKMADQLMLVDLSKVIQIQKDDFLCVDHDFDLLLYNLAERGTHMFHRVCLCSALHVPCTYTLACVVNAIHMFCCTFTTQPSCRVCSCS